MKDFTRREFIKVAGATGAALALAPNLPVFAEDLKSKVYPEGTKITFSSQGYGDIVNYQDLLEGLAKEFKEESNIEVEIQIVPWGNAMNHWLLTSQGGTAADCADMFWLYCTFFYSYINASDLVSDPECFPYHDLSPFDYDILIKKPFV